ncbi:MAG: hypothetical protein ACLTW7_14810 [Enterococcus sp.]|uniref:hypothetical protein n=1 Tax=Enterococcus sp. TaxID=35783 RepID=UPI00399140F9
MENDSNYGGYFYGCVVIWVQWFIAGCRGKDRRCNTGYGQNAYRTFEGVQMPDDFLCDWWK